MKLSVQMFQQLIVIYRRGIIIEDVHQFIGYCLIPLVPWMLPGGVFQGFAKGLREAH